MGCRLGFVVGVIAGPASAQRLKVCSLTPLPFYGTVFPRLSTAASFRAYAGQANVPVLWR